MRTTKPRNKNLSDTSEAWRITSKCSTPTEGFILGKELPTGEKGKEFSSTPLVTSTSATGARTVFMGRESIFLPLARFTTVYYP